MKKVKKKNLKKLIKKKLTKRKKSKLQKKKISRYEKKLNKIKRKTEKRLIKKPKLLEIKKASEKIQESAPVKIKEIKSKKFPKISTGINQFDKMTKGGYERNSINLVAGGSGSGKTIFALQFLINGFKKNEKGLYVTFEEKKSEVYENMQKMGIDLEKAEKSGKFIFLEYSPEKVKMMLDEGGGAIESIILKYGIKRMVIDSITSFSLLFEDDLSKRQAALGLFDIIRKWDVTTLLTVQGDPADRSEKGISSVEFEADSITLLYYINVHGERKRFIEVLKMRGTDHSDEIREFDIKKGIEIGKKTDIKKFI
jgi:circadian clock protein KaiC